MSKDNESLKSIIDRIYDELFSLLKVDDNFDEKSIQKLKDLATTGSLQKEKMVYETLREMGEIQNENNRA